MENREVSVILNTYCILGRMNLEAFPAISVGEKVGETTQKSSEKSSEKILAIIAATPEISARQIAEMLGSVIAWSRKTVG